MSATEIEERNKYFKYLEAQIEATVDEIDKKERELEDFNNNLPTVAQHQQLNLSAQSSRDNRHGGRVASIEEQKAQLQEFISERRAEMEQNVLLLAIKHSQLVEERKRAG
ncbi:hypothetical protein E4U41_005111 [Claviceps citrina]|nr:hypothetical protein E4U41_005111 [Claviceps citrina]